MPATLGASVSFQSLACSENCLAAPERKCYNLVVLKLSSQTSGLHFGFKLHLLAHSDGTILGAVLTPGNWDDRDVAAALAEGLEAESILIADLGYRDSKELEPLLAEQYGVVLVTRSHAPKRLRPLISCIRERIETVFSCFWNRFMDLVFSRSFVGLWSAIRMKMLHYTLCKAGILPPLNP